MTRILKLVTVFAVVAGSHLNADDFRIIGSVVDDSFPPSPVEASQVNVYLKSQTAGSGITDKDGVFTISPPGSGSHAVFELLIFQGRRYEPWTSQTFTAKNGIPFRLDGITLKEFKRTTASIRQLEIAVEIASRAGPNSPVALELGAWVGDLKQSTKKVPLALSIDEVKSVENCLAIIRQCQLNEGAIAVKNLGNEAQSPAWIHPYFANHAALALLAGNDRKKNPQDVERVRKWLDWCVINQSPAGFWFEFDTTREIERRRFAAAKNAQNGNRKEASDRTNLKIDAWDSSAAMFMIVVERFQHAGGKVTPELNEAVKRSVACIRAVTDLNDGLTWAKPDYRFKYLMDNIETYGGLLAAATILGKKGDAEDAAAARKMANTIATKVPSYWQPGEAAFAYVLNENGTFQMGFEELQRNGLAQLFAIGFLESRADAWTNVQKRFSPDRGELTQAGVEHWLVAASRMDSDETKEWRSRVTAEAATFTPGNIYIIRASVAALGLLQGADWMPGVLNPLDE